MSEVASSPGSPFAQPHLPSALRNVLSNWGGFLCSSIIAFFLSPFVVHHLGNSAYGIWVLVGSLTGYLGLLNLGVRSAVTRYVAQFHAESNDGEASSVASSALAIFIAAGAVAVLLSFALAKVSVGLFHIPESYRFAARIIIVLAGFSIAVSLIGGVFGGILTALHRFDLSNLIEASNSVLSAIAIVAVLSAGKGLIALSVVNLSFAVAACLAYAAVAFRVYPDLKLRLSGCDRDHLRLIFSFSVYAFLLQISFNLIFYTDSLVIGNLLSVSLITFFAIAGSLVNYSRMMIGGISTTMTPRASALEARSGQEEVQKLLIKATRLATIVILPVGMTFLLRGGSFIRLWMGQAYADASGHVLWILTLGLLFVAADQVATSTMMGIGAHRLVVSVVCGEALCNLVLSVLLARPMGIFGVAWGTALPSLAVSFLFWPWYLQRTLKIPVRRYVMSTWVRPAIAVIPFTLLTYGLEKGVPPSSIFVFLGQTAAILPVAAFASWYICLDHSDREDYTRRFIQPALKTILG